MFCREQATGFRSRQKELDGLGVGLVFIGSGTPAMAEDFRAFLQLDAPVWVDTRRESYRFLGFKRQPLMLLTHPSLWANGLRATRAGFRQGKTQGDPWQQGGVLVVRRGGGVEYAYASATAGDHPPLDGVLRAAGDAARAGRPSAA
jgi:hypothetical protein